MNATSRAVLFPFAAGAFAVAVTAASPVLAQPYPSKPLRFVIPFPPGGGADNLGRIVGQAAGDSLGQQIVIDNRAGAGGNIAADLVAHAAPDGYTLLQANISHAISASLYRKLDYNLLRDFTPVTQLASIPFLLAVTPSFSAASIKDLIALAKAKPGQLTYASSGYGGPSHMAMEMFKSVAGVNIRHVPYKGAAPAATDIMAGQVNMGFFTVSAALPLIAGGRLRPLAIASAHRTPLAPDIPTMGEAGLPGFEATTWFGVMAPRGTPASAVSRLNAAFTGALKVPAIRERLLHQGFEIVGSTPSAFGVFVRSEVKKWAQTVKAAHIERR